MKRLRPGASLGSFEVLSLIGAGGMGEVYKARDTRLGRTVAVKVLSSQVSDDAAQRERLEREARIVSSLNHPHICTLYDIGHHEDVTFLVMEFLEGETLAERLTKGPLPIDDALRYAREIAEALEEAHQRGLVHRDLKPANIVLTPHGAKLLDFGIAKPHQDRPDFATAETVGALTKQGEVVGTPQYMSPEQLEGKPATPSTDLFAFGALLYEMVTGRRAFGGASGAAIIADIMARHPVSLSSLRPEIPRSLETVVMRCLEKDPVRRWQQAKEVLTALGRVKHGEAIADSARTITSLAVLPLENLSRDPEQEYFADGMTDALITTLVEIGGLRVISRSSVMRYKGARRPLPEIARELHVEAVLEGTVLRSANRVRIGAQLVDATTDTHLWAKNYESDLRDVLTLQSDVARAIAREVRIQLTPQENARLTSARPVDPEAYESFLKGRHHWYRRSPEALQRALQYLQTAIAQDPTFVLAHAALADAYITLGWDLFAMEAPDATYPKAKEAATRALQLDPECAEAHAALGWAATGYDWDWVSAEASFRRAIELKPQYGPVHIWYSHLLKAVGRIEESSAESRRALECDPLGLVLNMHMGWHHLYSRNYPRAIQQLLKTLELDPAFMLALMFLGEAYEQTGEFEKAIAQFDKAVAVSQRQPICLAGLGHAYAVRGNRDAALAIVHELERLYSDRFVSARTIAEVYVGLKDDEAAFAWLERALMQRNGWLLHIHENPRYDSLRADPRYLSLVTRLKLPQPG